MSARLEKWLRDNIFTYRAVLDSITTSTALGAFLSIAGEANKLTKLRHVQISKPDTALTFQVARVDVTPTTGTYTELSPARISHSTGSTYGGVVRAYTVIPTLGGTTELFQTIDLSTSEVLNEHYGDRADIRTPELNGDSGAIILNSSVAAAVQLSGYVEFTREPI